MTSSDAQLGTDGKRRIEALYRQHSAWLIRRLVQGGVHAAEDVVQEAYLRTALYSCGDDIRHPKAFLLRIAGNIVRDRAAVSRKRSDAEGAATAGQDRVETSSEDDWFLQEIILGLPDPLRDVFVMSRFGGLSNAQIAERLGISPKTVEWRMTKALAHCAAQLR